MVTSSTPFALATSLQSGFSENSFNHSCRARAGADKFPRISRLQQVTLHAIFPKNGQEIYDHGYKNHRREYLIKDIPTGIISMV